jgi:signal transduction histidine kinase
VKGDPHTSRSGPAADTEWLVNQIAHTLRNPIFAAMVQAEALVLRAGEEERIANAARMVHKQLKRLEANINEMLLFGRPARVNPRAIDAVVVAERIAELFRKGERGEAAEVEVAASNGEIATEWDPDMVTVVLDRLIANAVQHTEPPHRVELRLEPVDSDSVRISVRDRGEGIPDALRERIFLPFYPQHSGRPGLGLAVAAKFVHTLGGQLDIDSVEGEGTEVRCVLPKRPPAGE